MLKHNKKRNVGLLNEFFAQYMATAAVEFRFEDYAKAETLWKKHFKKGTELSKELKLFEAIAGASLNDRNIAYDLLQKIKKHIKTQNQEKLDREKTNLIHEIRNELGDGKFFERSIGNYKTNATIQLVLNHWRNKDDEKTSRISQISHLEEQVIDHMVDKKTKLPPFDTKLLATSQKDINQLVVNLFREKIDKKYSNQLNEDQKEIIGLYTFAKSDEESKLELRTKLKKIQERTISLIEGELSKKNDKIPKERLVEVKTCFSDTSYNIDNPDETTITFYLSACSLKQELEAE